MFNAFTAALTNLDVMAAEMRWYPTIGIRQISTESGGREALAPARPLRIFPPAWNPNESWERILEDFCRHAYGELAEQMIEFWRYRGTAREPLLTRRDKNLETLGRLKGMTSDQRVIARLTRLEMLQRQPDPHPEWPE